MKWRWGMSLGLAVEMAGIPALAQADDITIYRDTYGIPHIEAPTEIGNRNEKRP